MKSNLGNLLAHLADWSRPIRRQVFRSQFKEWYINRALEIRDNPIYLEIGVRCGESFRHANAARKIGIDPVRTEPMTNLAGSEEFYELTSDEFFETCASAVLKPGSVDVALIDGFHEFTQVVRDLTNLEKFMKQDGLIFLDDVNPSTATRAQPSPTGNAWNGDVWKLAPLLLVARNDLHFMTVKADEGVGIVWGFGQPHDAITLDSLSRCKKLSYEDLDRDRVKVLQLVKPKEAIRLIEDMVASGSDQTTH